MRGLRVAFGLLLAASVGVLAWRAGGGLRVETDLTSLVSAENLPALRDVSADRTRQGRLLFEGPGADAVRAAADAFSSNLPACATFDLRATLRAFAGRTAGLLSAETRGLLRAGRYGEVATASAARLFGPVPPLFSVKDDPFLLATDYVLALQSNLSPGWSLRDGYPVCTRDGVHFLLVALETERLSLDAVENLRRRVEARNATAEDGVRIWCCGPLFHTARAATRAKTEVNVLSGVSVACVVLLGVLLFRSLRFVPQLLFAVGASFLVASGALFAVCPRPHALTFVFGTTLIGLAVDYVYHARAAGDVARVARPLGISLVTTLACFTPLLCSEVTALRQMALFTMAGLGTVFMTVFAWGPCGPGLPAVEEAPRARGPGRAGRWARALLLCGAALGLFRLDVSTSPAAFYRPDAYLAAGERRFLEVGPAAGTRVALVTGDSLQACLEHEEAAGLKGLSALIPSIRRQRENAALAARLAAHEGVRYAALTGLRMPGKAATNVFLDAEMAATGALKRLVAPFRLAPTRLVAPCPAGFVPADPHVEVLDPRTALEGLFARFLASTCRLLVVSLGLLAVLLLAFFRKRFFLYVGPVVASVAATGGMLGWLGIPLTSFTLLCFFVMVGLGLDYVVFQRSRPGTATRRTVRASFLSSLAGFGLLAFTAFPVTQAMGVTFAFGLFFAYVFSLGGEGVRRAGDVAPYQDVAAVGGTRRAGDVAPDQGGVAPSGVSAAPAGLASAPWHAQREQSAGRGRMWFMWAVYARCGKTALKLVTVPVMAFIYPFAGPARRALRTYYAVLAAFRGRKDAPPVGAWTLYRHLLGFAWSLADKTDACTLRKDLPQMSVRDDAGGRAFRDLVAARKGAFLVSTHLGTVEVLPALASARRGMGEKAPHVHAFQQMGHDAVFTRMFMRHFDATHVTLHAVEEIGVETAVRMQEAVGRGELVLMAGDRVGARSGKTFDHAFLGRPCRWPKGVFVFAKLMACPVFFVTCVRTGWNAYECHFHRYTGPASSPARMLDEYTAFLETETLAHPEQWYQFYDFFAHGAWMRP